MHSIIPRPAGHPSKIIKGTRHGLREGVLDCLDVSDFLDGMDWVDWVDALAS